MIQQMNMINHVMSVFVAIICFIVIYFAHEHDIPIYLNVIVLIILSVILAISVSIFMIVPLFNI